MDREFDEAIDWVRGGQKKSGEWTTINECQQFWWYSPTKCIILIAL